MADLVDVDLTLVALDLGDALSGSVALVKFITKDRNTPKLLAAFQEALAEWVIEERQQTAAQLRQLASHADDAAALAKQLEQLVQDPEFVRVTNNYGYEACREAIDERRRVTNNYGYEACREAIDERRRMLAFASAGSVNIDLSIAQIARVERTVRELDPDDALLLALVCGMADPPGPRTDDSMERQHWSNAYQLIANARAGVLEGTSSLSVLLASGCVRTHRWHGQTDLLDVTDVGRWVEIVLRGYVSANRTEERRDG